MNLVIKLVGKAEEADFISIYGDVYWGGNFPADRYPNFDDCRLRYVGWVDGVPVCTFSVNPYEIYREGVKYPVAGIAAVGVLPEFRHLGIGQKMMRWAIEELDREDYALANLYGFRESYYRQFGYEIAGSRSEIRVPSDRLPKVKSNLKVQKVAPEDAEKMLSGCYEKFAEAHNGANSRSSWHWTNRLGLKPPMIYAFGDPVEGYCWTHMEQGFWEEISFGEVAWSTPEGYKAFLQFARGLAINQSSLVWHESSQGPFSSFYQDQGAKISGVRPAMYRILNPCKLLGQSAEHLEIVNEADHLFNPEKVSCSIGSLTQAWLGEPSFDKLVYNGKIVGPIEKLKEFSKLMPARSVFCTEFF